MGSRMAGGIDGGNPLFRFTGAAITWGDREG
jgi:hypothetical protein